MRIRRLWKHPTPPPSRAGSSTDILPHEEEQEVSSPVVHTCPTWGTYFWECQISDEPDHQSNNRGTLTKRKEVKAAEYAQWILSSFSQNQDETPAAKRWKVCNFFLKKSCRMERHEPMYIKMAQDRGKANSPDHPGMQYPVSRNGIPSSSNVDEDDNEARKKRIKMSFEAIYGNQ